MIWGSWFGSLQAGQFKLSPLVIETETIRGSASGMFVVKNLGNKTVHLRVYSVPFTYNADGFKPLNTSSYDLSPYLIFAPRKLIIKPEQSRRVRLNVRFLPSMRSAEYRAMVFTEEIKPLGHDPSKIRIGLIPRIGVAVYVRHGKIKAQLSMLGIIYAKKSIVLQVQNTGKASARPRVNWVLKQYGTKITTGRNKPATVIAEKQRHIEIGTPEIKKLKAGTYQLSGKLVWGAMEKYQLTFQQEFVIP